MNGRRARELRRAAGPKPTPGYRVTRTHPLVHVDDRGRSTLVGHGSDNPRLVLTAAGRVSQVDRLAEDGVTKKRSNLHVQRIGAIQRRGMVDRVKGLIRRDAA